LDYDVRDLWGDGLGSLWVATAGGVNRINLKNGRIVTFTQPARPDRVAGDAMGNVWAVALGENGGVWQWEDGVWSRHTVSEGLSGGIYSDMHVAADGDVFLAGDRGLDIWDGEKWETFATLPGRHVKRIWQDGGGDVWVSSEITPGRPFNLSVVQGRSSKTVLSEDNSREMGPEPLALLFDRRGRIWLGAALGLFVYELDGDSRWHGVGPVEGVAAGSVSSLFEDSGGAVWVAVGELAFRNDYAPCGFASALSGSQSTAGLCGEWHSFEPGVGVVSQISAGPEDSILFAGDAGIALYHPLLPDLRLEGVENLVTGEVFDGSEAVVVPIGRNAIQIDLVTIAPTLSDRQISYRYRLEGTDEDWRVAPARALGGKRASITYAGLAGGVYTFTAVARTDFLDASPEVGFPLIVVSRPPELVLDDASVAGRIAELKGLVRSYVGQPVQFQLTSGDDQLEPLTYRYQVRGLGDGWTETIGSEISFTLSAAGIYTFVAMAVDDEGQSSPLVSSRIVVSERPQDQGSTGLPVQTIAAAMGVVAVIFIVSAIVLVIRRRRRESW
jgi:hypothetical protein